MVEEKLRGLKQVRLSAESLLSVVEENKEKHANQFAESYVGWKLQIIQQLEDDVENQRKAYRKILRQQKLLVMESEERLRRAKEGDFKTDKEWFKISCPVHHIKDYDATIKMLQMSLDDELELNEQEFGQFVMDEWTWKNGFASTHSTYSNTLSCAVSGSVAQGLSADSVLFSTGSIAASVLGGDFTY